MKININLNEIQSIPVYMYTSKDFGYLMVATLHCKNGMIYDILFDCEGELTTENEHIKPLSEFFNKAFHPGKIDGRDCLINTVKLKS